MVKSVRTVLGLTLVLMGIAACDDNPMKDGRDEGEYIFTNPSFSTVEAGDSLQVIAQVRNRYTAPTGDGITATPCDAKITVVADTTRTQFEPPERFWVYTGNTVGRSCLVVSGGGVTDTIDFIVAPADLTVIAPSPLGSGETAPISVTFQNTEGEDVTGYTIADVTFSSSATATIFVDDAAQTMTGRAPGTANVIATLKPDRGGVVTGSTPVTVVAGAFTGTFAPATLVQGSVMTLTAGAIPFDSDTKVRVGADSALILTQNATTITAVVPAVAASPATVTITNLGPNQVASVFNAPVAAEANEPDAFGATTRTISLGTTHTGVLTDADDVDYWAYTATGPRTLTLNLQWVGPTASANDVDLAVFTAGGTQLTTTPNCESSAKPEACTVNLPAAGTYYIEVIRWLGSFSQAYRLTVN